jgi:hypothetical protein
MSDPRNVAHAKKVEQEKEHHKPASGAGSKPKKRSKATAETDRNDAKDSALPSANASKTERVPGEAEKSAAVLSKLREMEFHSRANIETLAGLTLTIEDELKQKEFSDPMGELYSAQEAFHTKIAMLIEKYAAKCDDLKPSS